MQRGVLEFTPESIAFLLQNINKSPQQVDFLKEKLGHATQSGKKVKIELSEDEVDILLDILPVPQKEEDKQITQLRTNLQNFLMTLRDHSPKQKPSFWQKLNPFKKSA